MSKAVVVIDMPTSCDRCNFFFHGYGDMCCTALNNMIIDCPYPSFHRQDWCPLKPIPDKYIHSCNTYNEYENGYADGYNNCLNNILEQ